MNLSALDLVKFWELQLPLSDAYVDRWNAVQYHYEKITPAERDDCILRVIDTLCADIVKSGKHRRLDWEKGWEENKNLYQQEHNPNDLIPKYFDNINYIRFNNEWIKPLSSAMELTMLYQLVETFLDNFVPNKKYIYEFGCGTGHHLLRLRNTFPQAVLTGLDWAKSSQEIIRDAATSTNDPALFAENFDFFNPMASVVLQDDSVAMTVAALEQVGSCHKSFVDYLLKSRVGVVINFEPIDEMLSDENLLEGISKRYFKKREYLDGYLTYLRTLRDEGKIEILQEQRAHFGSFFIEGYSVVVWRPVRS